MNQHKVEALLTEVKFKNLGCRPLAKKDGSFCKAWKIANNSLERSGLASVSSGDWATEPVVIANQSLFGDHDSLYERMAT